MPITPEPDTSNTKLYNALKDAGYPVTLAWVQNQYKQGKTSDQIFAIVQAKYPNVGGGGGGGGGSSALNDFLNSIDGGSSGGGSGGSGGGGSSGSGGSAGLTAEQKSMLRANYLEVLRRWGLGPGQAGLGNLVDHAVNSEWSTTQFIQALRKTKAYHQTFPGIRWREGMTEGEYIRMYGAYRELSGNIGFKLQRAQFGVLLRKGVTASEFKVRIDALDRIKTYRPLLNEFEEVLKARGLLRTAAGKNKQLTMRELFRFVTKQGDPRWESLWQESVVRQGLEDAGLKIGRGGDFTRKEILKLIRQVDTPQRGVENLTLQDFQKLAENIQEVMPLSQLYGKGVTKQDLAVLALGGKGAPKIAERVQEILAQRNLSNEEKAAPQLVQTQKGSQLNYGGLAGESTQ